MTELADPLVELVLEVGVAFEQCHAVDAGLGCKRDGGAEPPGNGRGGVRGELVGAGGALAQVAGVGVGAGGVAAAGAAVVLARGRCAGAGLA